MRRIHFIVLPLIALAIGCTGGKSSDASDMQEPTHIVIDSFYSPDLAFADIRGHASQCATLLIDMEQSGDSLLPAEESLCTSIELKFSPEGYLTSVRNEDIYLDQPVDSSLFNFEFDEKGNLLSGTNDYGGRFEVKRNSQGYVAMFSSINSTGDVDFVKYYAWNGDRVISQRIGPDLPSTDSEGNRISIPSYRAKYSHDENGYRTQEVEESGNPDLQLNITTTDYTYRDFDNHGNWTKRDIIRVAKVYTVGPSRKRNLTDSVAIFQTETRQITYYN